MTDVPVADLGAGVAMPMVGFGTWQLKGRRAYEAVTHALEFGYRHIGFSLTPEEVARLNRL
jgi:2,5-diketo-D-gluconate reductase A